MFRQRRQAFLEQMEEGDVALFPGATHAIRSHDVEYPFRQESDFLYLTGLEEPDGFLILAKGLAGVPEESLFVLAKDPQQETWHGPRLGPAEAARVLEFEDAFSVEELEERAEQAVQGAKRLWFRIGVHQEMDAMVLDWLADLRIRQRKGAQAPQAILDPIPFLHEMRLRKSPEEAASMRKAAAITAEAHFMAMAQAEAGMGEWELEAVVQYCFRRHGGHWAYPPIVAGGSNACFLHYTLNRDPLRAGDLILLDAGAEYQGYAADLTRTFPVDGRFQGRQKEVYEWVLQAQLAAIEAVQPGAKFLDPHRAALAVLAEGLRDMKLLQVSVEEILEERLYRPWYMHNTCHWLGLDVHDAGSYVVGEEERVLQEGMVLTVEPGLYFSAADDRLPEDLRGLGVRIEDDVLVTGGSREVLTAAVPKTVAEVEAACEARRVSPPSLESPLGSPQPAAS